MCSCIPVYTCTCPHVSMYTKVNVCTYQCLLTVENSQGKYQGHNNMTSSLLTNRCAPLINRTRSCSLYTATIIPWLQPLHGVISSQDAPISSALYLSILSCFYARTRDLPHVLAGMLFECKRVDVEIGLFAFVFIAIDKIHHFFFTAVSLSNTGL